MEFSYSRGFKFAGLVNLFDLNELKNEFYFDDITPKMAASTVLVEALNQKIKVYTVEVEPFCVGSTRH